MQLHAVIVPPHDIALAALEAAQELVPQPAVAVEPKRGLLDRWRGRSEPEPGVEDEIDPENYVTAYWQRVDAARSFAVYAKGSVAPELVVAAHQVAAAWTKLARQVEKSLKRGRN